MGKLLVLGLLIVTSSLGVRKIPDEGLKGLFRSVGKSKSLESIVEFEEQFSDFLRFDSARMGSKKEAQPENHIVEPKPSRESDEFDENFAHFLLYNSTRRSER